MRKWTVNRDVFFRHAVQALKENASYSRDDDSWTIGVPKVRELFESLLRENPPEIVPSYILILEEGTRRGFWRVDYDHEYVADLVVLRQLR
jgi:hypothetical protein